jgi:hypothetical protein
MENVLTIRQKANKSGGLFTEPALRNLINEAEHNGLIEAGAIIRLGRRVLLDEHLFDAWVLSHRVGGKPLVCFFRRWFQRASSSVLRAVGLADLIAKQSTPKARGRLLAEAADPSGESYAVSGE